MTDTTEAPRNDAGQFASTEPAYGREGLERDAGYTPIPDDSKEEAPEELTKDEAAQRLKELSGPESAIITLSPIPGSDFQTDGGTLELDQAAKMVAEARKADKAQAEIDDTKAAQKEIDKLRGEKPAELKIETDEDVDRVLKSPKVQAAISAKLGEAETQRAQYEAAVTDAGKFAIASLIADFPEFADLPTTHWVNAIQVMHQREPARAQQMITKLQTLARVEAANEQIKTQKAAREQSEFKAYAAKENARFADMTKSIPAKEMAAIEAHVPKMLAEHGADVEQFLSAISNQTTFPRASAEALLVKAARYDLLTRAAKATPTRAVPTVQKPGHTGPRVNRADVSLNALSQKLNRSGSLKDAVALRVAQKKGR